MAPDEFEKRKALLKGTPEAPKEENPPPGPEAFATPQSAVRPIGGNAATPRKTPRTPGKSNEQAPRFFPLPEKNKKEDSKDKGRKKKVKDMDPQFQEEEVGW